MKKENDLLEETLAVAEGGYDAAYRFLMGEYTQNPEGCGPQTLYFLACLAGGAGMPQDALKWLRKAVEENGWWYRPEVLEDDDLAQISDDPAFALLKSVSDSRYAQAVSTARAVFTWERKKADRLFIAVHGNTQNGQTAREDWSPILGDNALWQLETVQSAEPDGYGTYRWSYDAESFLPVTEAMQRVANEGYGQVVCGGFSAGCDMLLRAVAYTPARCDALILQSPWIPMLDDGAEELLKALRQKGIELRILCGECDEDCLPPAKRLYEAAAGAKIAVKLTVQQGSRHQFPERPFDL